MARKPIKNNGFKGDAKLKHILPKYQRAGPGSVRSRHLRPPRPEEIVAETDEEFRLKKDVRDDEVRQGRGFGKKQVPVEEARKPQPVKVSILKLIAVVAGILILISSMAIAVQNRDEDSTQDEDSIEADGYRFLEDLLVSKELSYSTPADRGVFSPYKVQYVTAEELELGLETEYNFYIEIVDKSDYDVKYSRSGELGNPLTNVDLAQVPSILHSDNTPAYHHYDSNGSEVLLMNSFVNIKVTDEEVHPAVLTIMIWN